MRGACSMNDALIKGMRLNEAIKQSNEYKEYVEAKYELLKNNDLCQRLKSFKMRNQELQSHPGINPLDEVIELAKEYDEVLNDSVVSSYLQAEQKVCKLMQKVYDIIADGLEFGDLDE